MHSEKTPGRIVAFILLIIICLSIPTEYAVCDDYDIYAASYKTYDTTYEDILKMFLSEKQYAEYKNIVDRLAEIEHKVSQKITKDMSPEEIDAVYAPYRTEMDRLNERIFAIFEEAGFSLEITDECYTDDNTFCAAFEISDGKD